MLYLQQKENVKNSVIIFSVVICNVIFNTYFFFLSLLLCCESCENESLKKNRKYCKNKAVIKKIKFDLIIYYVKFVKYTFKTLILRFTEV